MNLNPQTQATLIALYSAYALPFVNRTDHPDHQPEFVIEPVNNEGDFRHEEAIRLIRETADHASPDPFNGDYFIVTERGDCPAIVAHVMDCREFDWADAPDSQYVAWMTTI